jgi:hypothetical protein
MPNGVLKVRIGAGWQAVPTLGPIGPMGPTGPQGVKGDTGATGASGSTAAHHANHEPGGSDALVGAAWLNQSNVFTQRGQAIRAANPYLEFQVINATVDARTFIINVEQASTGAMHFMAMNDALSVATSTPLKLYRDGTSVHGGNITIGSTRPTIVLQHAGSVSKGRVMTVTAPGDIWLTRNLAYDGTNWLLDNTAIVGSLFGLDQTGNLQFYHVPAAANPGVLTPRFTVVSTATTAIYGRTQIGGTTSAYPSLRAGNGVGGMTTALEVVTADNANWATMRAANFVSVVGANNLADLTCGPTNFTAGLTVTAGNSSIAGNVDFTGGHVRVTVGRLSTGEYIFPGPLTAPGTIQQSWYIASHSTYGLYTNTGLYCVGPIYTASIVQAGGAIVEYNRANAMGHWIEFTPSFVSGATIQSITTSRYNIVGKMVTYIFYMTINIPVAVSYMQWYIPIAANKYCGHSGWLGQYACMHQTYDGYNTSFSSLGYNGAACPVGTYVMTGAMTYSIA